MRRQTSGILGLKTHNLRERHSNDALPGGRAAGTLLQRRHCSTSAVPAQARLAAGHKSSSRAPIKQGARGETQSAGDHLSARARAGLRNVRFGRFWAPLGLRRSPLELGRRLARIGRNATQLCGPEKLLVAGQRPRRSGGGGPRSSSVPNKRRRPSCRSAEPRNPSKTTAVARAKSRARRRAHEHGGGNENNRGSSANVRFHFLASSRALISIAAATSQADPARVRSDSIWKPRKGRESESEEADGFATKRRRFQQTSSLVSSKYFPLL